VHGQPVKVTQYRLYKTKEYFKWFREGVSRQILGVSKYNSIESDRDVLGSSTAEDGILGHVSANFNTSHDGIPPKGKFFYHSTGDTH